jgi:chromosome partitioning protein
LIIVIGGIKGGSGKTTAATNLAVMRALAGVDLLLVDADDAQETAYDFTQLRSEHMNGDAGYTTIKLDGAAVRTQVNRLADKYEDILIDTGGRDSTAQRSALGIANLLLVPFVPRSFDIWTLEKVAELVTEMRQANQKLKAWTFLNRADSRGQDNDQAAEALRDVPGLEFIDVSLGTRKAFGNAAALGQAVAELKNPDPKALEEISALYASVFGTSWAPKGTPVSASAATPKGAL